MTYEAYTAGIERAELLGKVASVMSENVLTMSLAWKNCH